MDNTTITKKLKTLFIASKENNYQPCVLHSDFLFPLILGFFILRIIALPLYYHFPKSAFFAKIVSSEIVSLLNNERQTLGLSSLEENSQLTEAAISKAQDMLKQDYFGHKSPSGVPAWYFIEAAGYRYQVAGENLAIGFLDSSEVHQAWNNSPLHKQNLLDPRFQEIGVGVAIGDFQGNETTVVVQLFGQAKEGHPAASTQAPLTTEPQEQKPEKPIASIEGEQVVNEEPQESLTETPVEGTITQETPEQAPEQEEIILDKEIEQGLLSDESNNFSTLQADFWEFFANGYSQIIQHITLGVAIFLSSVLVLNLASILRLPISAKPRLLLLRDSVPGALLGVVILVILGLTDKSLLVQLIPHSLKI